MKVQLCWREKGDFKLHVSMKMPVKEARRRFAEMNNKEITLAYLRRWEGYGYICHKVLKDKGRSK